MNRVIGKIIIILLFLTIAISNFNISNATSLSDIENAANGFVNQGRTEYNHHSNIGNSITEQVRPVVKILSVIGILVIGCCMVILGTQWVLSKPSPEAQSKLKHRFVALAIAALVLFGAYSIWSIVISILDSIGG